MAKGRLTKDQIEQRKNHAKLLYTREGVITQKELAQRVSISEKTIGLWIKEEGWERLQKNFLLTREEQMANLLDELAQLNAFIKLKPEGLRFADAKEGDVRRKLIKDIKELETKALLPDIIHACAGLLDFIRKADLSKAQELGRYVDAFIKSQLR
ncbi:MAG: DDE transposase family protein [Daejeonella sp.]